MNLIEKLKQNEKPYGLNSKAEQECFEKVGRENCVFLLMEGNWELTGGHSFFSYGTVYRIKPDYLPEPQTERCEVKPRLGRMTYERSDGNCWKWLHEALSDPDFMYFEYEDGKRATIPRKFKEHNKPADIPKWVLFARPK